MIGCTRQSVNKLLGMFTDDGLIRLERDRIVILDLDGLPGRRTARRSARRARRPARRAGQWAADRRQQDVRRRRAPPGSGRSSRRGTPCVARDGPSRARRRRPRRPCRRRAAEPGRRPRRGLAELDAAPGEVLERRSASAWLRAVAVSAAERLAEPKPVAIAEQGRERPARRDLDHGQASSRAPPSAAPIASAQVVSPSAQTWSPSDAPARDPSSPRRAPRRVGRLPRSRVARRDPDVDGIRPGVGRDDRVRARRSVLAEEVRDLRFADPGQPQRPARRPARRRAPRAGAGRGRTTSGASRGAGRAARRSTRRPAGRPTSPGAVPFGFGQRRRRRDQPGLLQVHLGERHARAGPSRSRSQRSSSGSTAGVLADAAAIASRVRSSGVGPRPPVDTTRSARRGARRTRRATVAELVGQGLDPPDRDARAR